MTLDVGVDFYNYSAYYGYWLVNYIPSDFSVMQQSASSGETVLKLRIALIFANSDWDYGIVYLMVTLNS